MTEELQNTDMTWTNYDEIAATGHCGRAVLRNVCTEHVEGLGSKTGSKCHKEDELRPSQCTLLST